MSTFGDYKAYKRYEPYYAGWKFKRDADEAKRIYKGLYSYVHGNSCEYKDKVSTCRRDNVIYLNRI